jgi:hypothetical protein
MLQWTTSNETSSSVFEIEKSTDNINFAVIGSVAAGGQTLPFTDLQPATGASYYRIRQLDVNGVYRYSAIIPVDLSSEKMLIVLYPNPAITVANIKFRQSIANVVITLTSASGSVVYATTASAITAGQIVPVPRGKLASGIYILHVRWNGGKVSQQLLVN